MKIIIDKKRIIVYNLGQTGSARSLPPKSAVAEKDQKEVKRTMNKYQLLYIIDNSLSEESKNELIEKFKALIESDALGGTVDTIDKWGAKKLAYEIDGKTEGYYVLVKFSANVNAPAEIDRQMKINDNIIRQMITRV